MPASISRIRATNILLDVEQNRRQANLLLAEMMRDATLDPRDQNLIQHIVKGTLENRASIDALLDPLVKGGLSSLKPVIQIILRMAVYQFRHLDRVPKEAAVFDAVEIAKTHGSQGVAGLVNGVLRSLLRQPHLLEVQAEDLATLTSHPQWMVDRVTKQFGTAMAGEFFRYNNTKWPMSIQANTLLTSRAELKDALSKEGVVTDEGSFDFASLTVRSLPKGKRLHELEPYLAGHFQIQDESASLVAKISPPMPGQTVIDLCSAPGGKAVNLACLMGDQGRIIALDPSAKRLAIVRENLTRQKISCVELAEGDGRTVQADPVDLVLVDAPCSGLGVLGRKADARWNKEEDEPERLHALQLELLGNAANLVKVGGKIIYSTCSIDLMENEGTANRFLELHRNFKAVPCSLPEPLVTTEGYYRTWPPRDLMAGAFGMVAQRVS